jgi:hypothetical protein
MANSGGKSEDTVTRYSVRVPPENRSSVSVGLNQSTDPLGLPVLNQRATYWNGGVIEYWGSVEEMDRAGYFAGGDGADDTVDVTGDAVDADVTGDTVDADVTGDTVDADTGIDADDTGIVADDSDTDSGDGIIDAFCVDRYTRRERVIVVSAIEKIIGDGAGALTSSTLTNAPIADDAGLCGHFDFPRSDWDKIAPVLNDILDSGMTDIESLQMVARVFRTYPGP